MRHVTQLHLDHLQALFLNERSRREGIRGSLSTPVAAISFSVFAFSSLAVEVDPAALTTFPMRSLFVGALRLLHESWPLPAN